MTMDPSQHLVQHCQCLPNWVPSTDTLIFLYSSQPLSLLPLPSPSQPVQSTMFTYTPDYSIIVMCSEVFAYFVSILINLIAKKGADLLIETEDECLHNGKLLLISVANGCYCGGGIKSNPLSDIKNGFIELEGKYYVTDISRLKFLSLLPSYMKGRHIYKKNIEKIINTKLCHKIKVRSLNGKIKVCVDGEIINSDSISFEIKPNAFKFVVPKRKEHSQYDTKTSERFSV